MKRLSPTRLHGATSQKTAISLYTSPLALISHKIVKLFVMKNVSTDRLRLERFAHEATSVLLGVAAVGVEGLRHCQDDVVHR
jgi:hypothetical protein